MSQWLARVASEIIRKNTLALINHARPKKKNRGKGKCFLHLTLARVIKYLAGAMKILSFHFKMLENAFLGLYNLRIFLGLRLLSCSDL